MISTENYIFKNFYELFYVSIWDLKLFACDLRILNNIFYAI